MHIFKTDLCGSDYVGLFSYATDAWAIVPPSVSPSLCKEIENVLNVPVSLSTVGQSPLIGLFCAGNSKGLLVPYFTDEKEIKHLEKTLNINIGVLTGEATAVGNLFVVNDSCCIVDPMIDKQNISVLEETLQTKVVEMKIHDHYRTGAVVVATNKGGVAFPHIEEKDINSLEKSLNVEFNIGTVNKGSLFVKSGLIANSHGFIVGKQTTGPEIARLDESLKFL